MYRLASIGRLCLRLAIELSLKDPDLHRCCQAHRQSPDPLRLRKRSRRSGSFPPAALPGFIGTTAPSDSHRSRRPKSASRSLPSPRWVCPVSRITFPTCCAHYPGGSNGCSCRLLPRPRGLPVMQGGRHPRLHFRGLLRLHSRYGPSSCSTAQGGLCHEASIQPVAQPNRSSATRPIDNCLSGFFLHWLSVPFGAHCINRASRSLQAI